VHIPTHIVHAKKKEKKKAVSFREKRISWLVAPAKTDARFFF